MTPIFYDSWGKACGNFSPADQGYQLVSQAIKDAKKDRDIGIFFAPNCAFTNRVVAFGEDDDKCDDLFYRTRNPADGGIVSSTKTAVVIFNADCPIVAIYDENAGRLAVLHAGFRCLVPIGGRNADNRSIIEVAFADHKFRPDEVNVFVGFGIGPCCYGAEHLPEVKAISNMDIPIGRATRGPRAGKQSVDLYTLIRNQLIKIGVPERRIAIDSSGPACARHSDYRSNEYWSNCWDGPAAGRNATFAWFR